MIQGVVWTLATVAVYLLCERLWKRLLQTPLLHPVATSTAILIVTLLAFRVPYAVYARATVPLTFLLVPATIALAVPLFHELRAIRRNAGALGAAILAGSSVTVLVAMGIARAFGCDAATIASLAPKAVTTPVAMAVSAEMGGLPALSAVFAIVSGIVGAMLARAMLRRFRPWIAGLAIGTCAHGVGTARLFSLNRTATAFSSLAMGLNAMLTAVVLPPLAALVEHAMR